MNKKCLPLFVFGLVLTLSSNAQEIYKYATYGSKDNQLPYRIHWPADFDTDKKYPVMLFLHGAGERGNDNEKQLVHGSSLFVENQQQYPAIVIFPQCPTAAYWSNVTVEQDQDGSRNFNFRKQLPTSQPLVMVAQLMDSVTALPYVDKQRCYLGGLSMGGMGSFELLSIRPIMFAAAIIICGGGNPDLVDRYANNVALWIFHGDKDSVVPSKHSKAMVAAIKKLGKQVKFSLYPKVNHNSWDKAFSEADLLSWLFSHTSKH